MSIGLCSPGTSTQATIHTISNPFKTPTLFLKPSSLKVNTRSFGAKPIKATSTSTCFPYTNSETFYDLLGISETGTFSEIKKAYKQLARKYHPDVSPPDRTEEYTKRFIKVKEAYETLADPRSRALYDRDIATGLHLAFSARNQFHHNNQRWDERAAWQRIWQSQLMELKRRGFNKDLTDEKMSWGSRMRRQNKAIINL